MPGSVILVKSPLREITGSKEVPTAVILLNDHDVKLLSNLHNYTYRFVLPSLVREASFCSDKELIQRLIVGENAECK